MWVLQNFKNNWSTKTEKKIEGLSHLPFANEPSKQLQFKFTSSILVAIVALPSKCVPAGSFFFVKHKTSLNSEMKTV